MGCSDDDCIEDSDSNRQNDRYYFRSLVNLRRKMGEEEKNYRYAMHLKCGWFIIKNISYFK